MVNLLLSRYYQFGDFRLDAEGRRLLKGSREIGVTPKVFDTLLELVRSDGRLIERDDLMKKVWPDSFVEEGNIKVTIFNLRKALDDSQAEIIQTVPRRGYRLAVKVMEIDDLEVEASAPVAKVVDRVRSMAVLPFKIIGTTDEEYLGFGLADAIVIKLSGFKDIVVRPTSSVRRYIGSDLTALEIARELNVGAVLEGNIYRAGDRIRVTAQFVTTGNAAPLWAEKFEERLTDIFDVEDSISEQVAKALTLKLSEIDKVRLSRHYTENIDAYRLYLKGRYHWAKRTSETTRVAAELFRAAIDLDPHYTLAYAGLADCYAQLAWLTVLAPAEALPVAKAAAQRALELDELLAEAHASLAWIRLIYDLDYVGAEESFRRALELNPNYSVARMWYGVFLIALNRLSAATDELSKALQLDPLSPIINAVASWPLYFGRDYQRHIESLKKAIELEPNSLPAHFLLGNGYLQKGMALEAVEEMQTAVALDRSCLTVSGLAQAYVLADRVSEAKQLLTELDRKSVEKEMYVSPYDLAGVYARFGDHERALNKLEETFQDRSAWRLLIPVDPRFDALRGDRRFIKLLDQMNLPTGSDYTHPHRAL